MTSLEQRWLDEARRTKRCPECDAPARDGSLYCSVWCVEMSWRREIRRGDDKRCGNEIRRRRCQG